MSTVRREGIGMTSVRTRTRLIARLRAEGIQDERVLAAMREVPRHIFIDEALASRAYEDTALPIGFSQTISQPYIVALMTQALLERDVPRKVLEVGTGSGYQTAILARLVAEVYTVECVEPLMRQAMAHLRELELRNVRFRHGDGNRGWPEHAPYDGIIVTAAPAEVPPSLLDQLAPGGRLVIPVGDRRVQRLLLIENGPDGLTERQLELVNFVPLVGGED